MIKFGSVVKVVGYNRDNSLFMDMIGIVIDTNIYEPGFPRADYSVAFSGGDYDVPFEESHLEVLADPPKELIQNEDEEKEV